MKNILASLSLLLIPAFALADATYTEGINSTETLTGNVTVSGKTELHVTSVDLPFDNAKVDLKDNDSWLFIHAMRPSAVKEKILPNVTINGSKAVHPDNVRLGIWGSGCVIIPNGHANDEMALTVYDKPNCEGNSKTFEIHTFHAELGDWDNKIQSIKVKRGYMATLANNPDGTGHSRCFIADEEDLVVNVLPEGFLTYNGADGAFDAANTKSFVSFIRVLRWEWPGKKGWGGWNEYEINLANVDSHYGWSAKQLDDKPEVGFYAMDREFVPIKQSYNWPTWDEIKNLQNVSHLLGYNEPDHTDQSNVSVETALLQWPNYLRTGLRLGSPAPGDPNTSWFKEFFQIMDRCNYRCDFTVAHIYKYWNINNWESAIKLMKGQSSNRPVWITEYNNGANWTKEKWPDGTRDASEINLEHQRQWAEKLIPALDTLSGFERGHYYNWVENCRAFVLNDSLTPAGEIFAKHISVPAYNKDQAYHHTWKIAPPYFKALADATHENVTITFYDHNGETGKQYDVYRLSANGWELTKTLVNGVDYQPGETVTYTEEIPADDNTTIYYKVQAVSYKGTKSEESPLEKITPCALGKPNITVVETTGNSVTISWNNVKGATSYNIKRGTSRDELRTIEYDWEDNTYCDVTTTPATAYFYSVGAKNKWVDPTYSATLRVYSGAAGIEDAALSTIEVQGSHGAIIITSDFDCTLPIYSIDGRIARKVEAINGTTVVNGLQPGIYIVNRQKIVVK